MSSKNLYHLSEQCVFTPDGLKTAAESGEIPETLLQMRRYRYGVYRGISPESSPHPFRVWIWILPSKSDARYTCGRRRHKLHVVRFRAGTKSSLIPLFLLFPKSLSTFRGPRRSWRNRIPSSRSFSCGRRNFPSLIPTGRGQMHPF